MHRKEHWNSVYSSKSWKEVSWYEEIPIWSIEKIKTLCPDPNNDYIIDIGGGSSLLSDYLLREGFEHLSVLDISTSALELSQSRLSEDAKRIEWIVSDITAFKPTRKYDLWHDRATFHFLTHEQDLAKYVRLVESSVREGGHFIIGTFSKQGPLMCSGIPIQQYSGDELQSLFTDGFECLEVENRDHTTPSGKVQNFSWGVFRRKSATQ